MGKCKMNVMNLDVFRQSFMVAMVNCRLNKDEILLPAEYISVHAGGRSTVLTAHDVQGAAILYTVSFISKLLLASPGGLYCMQILLMSQARAVAQLVEPLRQEMGGPGLDSRWRLFQVT